MMQNPFTERNQRVRRPRRQMVEVTKYREHYLSKREVSKSTRCGSAARGSTLG